MLGLLTALLLGALPEDQLECEQAISHLRECCDLQNADVCGSGCNPITLSLEESDCIRTQSCADLEAAGVCERVQALAATWASADSGPRAEVCP